MVFPVKKLISLTAAALLSLTLLLPAAADTSSAKAYTIVNGENFCTGTFESAATGILPQKGTNEELSSTQGWRSNEYDYKTTSIVDKGYGGGKCLQIEGNGNDAYGAAYYVFPKSTIKKAETYQITFLYKVTDPLTKTNQLHCDVMDGGTGPIHTLVVGLAQRPGVDVGDGWKQVSGTFVAQAPSSFKAIRFFAEFNYNGAKLGNEANILIDNVEICKISAKAGTDKAVELSDANLVRGGDFEYKNVSTLYDPNPDVNGWWTAEGDKMAATVVEDGGSKALRMAGNMMLSYGSAYVNFSENLKPGKSYRLMFDYKFLGTTREDTMQTHVAFMQDPDKMPGNLGGWSNVNLVTNDLGESLPNGYKRVTVDYTPTDFEAGAVYGLRFFIALAEQGPDFGVLFDNVRVSEILGDASTPGTKPPDNNQNNNPPVTSPNGGDGTTSPDGSAPEITDPDGSLPSGGASLPDSSTVEAGNNATGTAPSDSSDLPGGTGETGGFPWLPVVLIAAAVLLLGGGGGFAYWYFKIRPGKVPADLEAGAEPDAGSDSGSDTPDA